MAFLDPFTHCFLSALVIIASTVKLSLSLAQLRLAKSGLSHTTGLEIKLPSKVCQPP